MKASKKKKNRIEIGQCVVILYHFFLYRKITEKPARNGQIGKNCKIRQS